MKPSQVSAELRRIAAGIDSCSTKVRPDLVSRDLRRVIAAVRRTAADIQPDVVGFLVDEESDNPWGVIHHMIGQSLDVDLESLGPAWEPDMWDQAEANVKGWPSKFVDDGGQVHDMGSFQDVAQFVSENAPVGSGLKDWYLRIPTPTAVGPDGGLPSVDKFTGTTESTYSGENFVGQGTIQINGESHELSLSGSASGRGTEYEVDGQLVDWDDPLAQALTEYFDNLDRPESDEFTAQYSDGQLTA